MRKWRLKIEVHKNIQILRVEEPFCYIKNHYCCLWQIIYLWKARLKLWVLLINIFGVDIPYYRKLSIHVDEENLRYTKLTPIFQKLGLHTWKWREIFENNVRLTLFYANLLQYKLMYLNEKT